MSNSEAPEIVVITTGGTLDKAYFDARSQYEIEASVIPRVLATARVTVPVKFVELMRKDSLDMTDDDRQRVREAVLQTSCRRIVITHGTDTMAATAHVLADIPDKVMVLTGALSPARFAESDAIFNVGMAFGAVQCQPPGVYIAMNGHIFNGQRVVKNLDRQSFEALGDDPPS